MLMECAFHNCTLFDSMSLAEAMLKRLAYAFLSVGHINFLAGLGSVL